VTSRLDFPWTVAIAVLAAVATVVVPDWMIADGRTATEPWRAATGPFVHATSSHLVRDLCLTGLVGIVYEHPLRRGWVLLVLLGLVVPTVAVLSLTGVTAYFGLSGLSHALLAAALGVELRRRRGGELVWVAAVAVGFTAKVVFEAATGAPVFPLDLGEVVPVPLAHAAGAAVGYAWALGRTSGKRASYAATTSDTARSSGTEPVLISRS
jgi:rhomboid family GlyGly-CTERM serine protease